MLRDADHPLADQRIVRVGPVCRYGVEPFRQCQSIPRLAAAWEADMADRSVAPATRDAYGRVARGYLVFLESRGVRCLGDADGASVLGFLEALSTRWARSSLFWVVSNFRPFLKFTGRPDLVRAAGLAGVKRSHAILPVVQ